MRCRLSPLLAVLAAGVLGGCALGHNAPDSQAGRSGAVLRVAAASGEGLPNPSPSRYQADSAKRAAAEFLAAWHERSWESMDAWASPANNAPDVAGQEMLKMRYGDLTMSGFKLLRDKLDGDGSAIVTVRAWDGPRSDADNAHGLLIHLSREAIGGEPQGADSAPGRWVVTSVDPITLDEAGEPDAEEKALDQADQDEAEAQLNEDKATGQDAADEDQTTTSDPTTTVGPAITPADPTETTTGSELPSEDPTATTEENPAPSDLPSEDPVQTTPTPAP
jgi:hypothetical protein